MNTKSQILGAKDSISMLSQGQQEGFAPSQMPDSKKAFHNKFPVYAKYRIRTVMCDWMCDKILITLKKCFQQFVPLLFFFH